MEGNLNRATSLPTKKATIVANKSLTNNIDISTEIYLAIISSGSSPAGNTAANILIFQRVGKPADLPEPPTVSL